MWTYRAHIVRVIDGDTIQVICDLGFRIKIEMRIRLLGVNTPELHGEQKEAGEKAKLFVQERLADGSLCVIRTEKSDAFGRYLANLKYLPGCNDELIIDSIGRSLNQELLDFGMAKEFK